MGMDYRRLTQWLIVAGCGLVIYIAQPVEWFSHLMVGSPESPEPADSADSAESPESAEPPEEVFRSAEFPFPHTDRSFHSLQLPALKQQEYRETEQVDGGLEPIDAGTASPCRHPPLLESSRLTPQAFPSIC